MRSITLVSPANSPLTVDSNISVISNMIELSNKLKGLHISNLILTTVSRCKRKKEDHDVRIAYLFRPADVIVNSECMAGTGYIVLLVHMQDISLGLLAKALPILKTKTVIVTTKYAYNELQAIGIESTIIPLPIIPHNSLVAAEKRIANLLINNIQPTIGVWTSTSVRKNSWYASSLLSELYETSNIKFNLIYVLNTVDNKLANKYMPDNIPKSNILLLSNTSRSVILEKLMTSHIILFPSFDEGYSLQPRECINLGSKIVMVNNPIHREIYDYAPFTVELIPTRKRLIYPRPDDEFTDPIIVDYPDMKSGLDIMHNMIASWKTINQYKLDNISNLNIPVSDNINIKNKYSKVLNIPNSLTKTSVKVSFQ